MKRLILLTAAWFWFLPAGYTFAQKSTNPVDYTRLVESTRRGGAIELGATFGEIDDQSLIEVRFEEDKMALPLSAGNLKIRQIEIRVEAFQTRNGVQTPIAPIDNYVSRQTGGQPAPGVGDPPAANVAIAYVFNDKPYDGDMYQQVPDTILNLSELGANDADRIEIRVTNLATQETLVRILTPRAFGFRVGMTDSLLFLKRLSVSQQDERFWCRQVRDWAIMGYGASENGTESSICRTLVRRRHHSALPSLVFSLQTELPGSGRDFR